MKILVFSWRDIKHPWRGGSEVYLHELSKRLVKSGHQVTMFVASHPKGSSRRETVDGINIVRRGNYISVYLWAIWYYFKYFRHQFDLIIDQHNGIPFFTPAYISSTPVICLVHHFHLSQWFTEMSFPLNYIGYFLERYLFPFCYRHNQIISVSNSTKDDLISYLGFKSQQISIVKNGVNSFFRKTAPKTPYPSVLYVGRLKKYKNIDILIRSILRLKNQYPKIILHIVGDGDDKDRLVDLAERLKISNSVIFHGFASESLKREFLSSAWVMVNPSNNEGWGITVIEAAACGTTSIGSKINGLQDSIIDQKTGLLFTPNNVFDLSKKLNQVLNNSLFRYKLEKNAYRRSKSLTWSNSVQKLIKILRQTLWQNYPLSSFKPLKSKIMSKQNHPLVSVIVPTKNVASFASKCFQSIQNQTYDNYEFIVVDGYSTDQTYQLAKQYTKQVYSCGPERNQQRNYAVTKAKGKYLMFIDSDMTLDPELISDCVYRMEKNKKSVACILPEIQIGKSIWSQARALEKSFYLGDQDIESPRFFLKEAYLASGGYDEKLLYAEDMELTSRIKKLGKIVRSVFYVYHDEDRLSYFDILRKKYKYGQTAKYYFAKAPKKSKKTTGFLRPSFVKNWRRFLDNPTISVLFIFLRTTELSSMGFGYLFSLLKTDKNEETNTVTHK
ncbi:MAG: glycosyltransferase [Patescibacteria group bacterium]